MMRDVLWKASVDELINDSFTITAMFGKPFPKTSACYSYIDRILLWIWLYKEDVKAWVIIRCLVSLVKVGNVIILTIPQCLADTPENKWAISFCIVITNSSFQLKSKENLNFSFFLNFRFTLFQPDNFLGYSFLNQN